MEKSIYIGEYKFDYCSEIKPQKDAEGVIIQYNPKDKYNNVKNLPLNKHGHKLFCKFSVSEISSKSGVYALFIDDDNIPIYIGRASNLKKRWSFQQYGSISPKNCFKGGQSTNCKINAFICNCVLNGHIIKLFCLATDKYIEIEKELIEWIKPKLNGRE